MIAELGLFSLVLALLFASLLVFIPTLGFWRSKPQWVAAAPSFVGGQFVFVSLAWICLTVCFLQDDFSVLYVMMNSSVALPWFYKLCAVWGGHEGSMLLWVCILSLWMTAICLCSKHLSESFRVRVLVVLGLLSIGFLLFLLTSSNPFTRQFQWLHSQGRDLNPLLQDPGFLFHPPMLYMGYVGFSVAFAFAIAALWLGRLESSWAKWARPWTLAAWCCLTVGITLGSWWAYRELGWGGWWFWDPVENASFMPWLIGTALLHSLAVSEKRQQFMAWTLLLAITAFSLSLVGTFLVRSGVLTSVHAFAVDPQRGIYILSFLLFVIGGSLALFGLRAQTLAAQEHPAPVSKDSALLLNNVFLAVIMLTVLMGTVYPLLIDALGLGKLSVGAPYFNAVFVPLMMPLLFLMGLGIHLKWQKDKLQLVMKSLSPILLASLFLPWLILWLCTGTLDMSAVLGLSLAFWIILSTLKLLLTQIRQRGLTRIGPSFWGMAFAHLGMAVSVIGVTVSSGYGIGQDVKINVGETTEIAGYNLLFKNQYAMTGPNYQGTRTHFIVRHGNSEHEVYPEKRIYTIGKMAMTESAIDVNPFRDIYVALGEPLDDGAWSVRLYYKPLVRWIWGGGFLMFFGGLCALADRRYYRKREAQHLVLQSERLV